MSRSTGIDGTPRKVPPSRTSRPTDSEGIPTERVAPAKPQVAGVPLAPHPLIPLSDGHVSG